MEILRVPPYPLEASWVLPLPDTNYSIQLEDLVDHSIQTVQVVSDSSSKVTYQLPREAVQFDREFSIRFYDENDSIVIDENLSVYRPYVDPNTLGTTASEIAEYKMLEIVARAIMDEFISHGFYNHKLVIQGVGTGTDYFPIWHQANRVLKVYENDILLYDIDAADPADNSYEFKIMLDNSAIYRVLPAGTNRSESAPIVLPSSRGDIWNGTATEKSFMKTLDYTFVMDVGNKSIPADIEYAAKLLIDDLKCGKLDYYKRYISSYNTDQFRIQFDKKIFEGTGNIIVDKILGKYVNTIGRLGAL